MQRYAVTLAILAGLICACSARLPDLKSRRSLLQSTTNTTDHCLEEMGSMNVTVLFVADPGEFSSTPEAAFLLHNLKDRKDLKGGSSLCPSRSTGTIMGQPVVVITTGIGPTPAALCTTEVLMCADYIREAIYLGTSGWSPQFGGVLNADNCYAPGKGKPIMIGDVCITPWAINWNCKKADWEGQCLSSPNLCFRPMEINGPADAFLYGQCVFENTPTAATELADEIYASAISENGTKNYLSPKKVVVDWEKKYWGAMSRGTNMTYKPAPSNTSKPTIYNRYQCVEVDGQFFYSGTPWEITARDYAALTINMATKSQIATPTTVVAVAAMEAVGFGEAMEKYNRKESTERLIPYTNIRATSNWLHHPVGQVSPGLWEYNEDVPEDFTNGYRYAISSTSATVLTWLQSRCYAAAVPDVECTFDIPY